MRLWLFGAAAVLAAAGISGCSADSAQQEISGVVELNGRPVKDGYIRFAPMDGKSSSAEVFIKEGKYFAKLARGNYQVEIYSPHSKGKPAKRIAGPGGDADEIEETIPPKYNVKTTLKLTVIKDKNEYDFSLQSN
jgi:hypothetical protein